MDYLQNRQAICDAPRQRVLISAEAVSRSTLVDGMHTYLLQSAHGALHAYYEIPLLGVHSARPQ